MLSDKKNQNIVPNENQDNSNLRLTITYFTFNNTEPNRRKQLSYNKQINTLNTINMINNRITNTSYKSRNQMNKIYSRKKNIIETGRDSNNHIIFNGQKGHYDVKNNMFLTWRDRNNKIITQNNKDSNIIHDIIKKIKSTELKPQNKLPCIINEQQQSNSSRKNMKKRWQSSKQVNTPFQLVSRKLQYDNGKSKKLQKKPFQIKNIQKPILLSKFMDVNKQKSCILRISGWQANYGGFQEYNI